MTSVGIGVGVGLHVEGDYIWQSLGMTDLGAAAVLNSATRTYRNKLAFLDVQSGDTPSIALSVASIGTLLSVTRPFDWEPAAQALCGLWTNIEDVTASAWFLELPNDNDCQIYRGTDVGDNLIQTNADVFDPSTANVCESTWGTGGHTVYVNGTVRGTINDGGTYKNTINISLGHDPQAASREIDGEAAWLYYPGELTAPQRAAVVAELLAAAS